MAGGFNEVTWWHDTRSNWIVASCMLVVEVVVKNGGGRSRAKLFLERAMAAVRGTELSLASSCCWRVLPVSVPHVR